MALPRRPALAAIPVAAFLIGCGSRDPGVAAAAGEVPEPAAAIGERPSTTEALLADGDLSHAAGALRSRKSEPHAILIIEPDPEVDHKILRIVPDPTKEYSIRNLWKSEEADSHEKHPGCDASERGRPAGPAEDRRARAEGSAR